MAHCCRAGILVIGSAARRSDGLEMTLQQVPSLNHIIGASEQRGRDREAKSLSRFEVDHQLVFGVLFDGEVNRLGALDNSSGVGPYLLIPAPDHSPITHQPAAIGEPAEGINRGHCVAGRERDKLFTPSYEERVRDHEQCISPLLDHDAEGCVKVGFSMGGQHLQA
jgi:hypothetical protein